MRIFHFAAFLATAAAALAAEPHPSIPKPALPDSLGVNIHFTDPRAGELEMLTAAGFRWVRMDFGWGGTERKAGEYDFSAYDRLAATLERHQLRAVFILDYGNPLYDGGSAPHTDAGRAAFAKWAVAAVKHFAGRGYLWEMWNEPNHEQFWKPKPDPAQYAALARATGEALRAAGVLGPQGEAFIGPATSTIDLPYLEACFKAGVLEFFDAVSVHPYRQTAPETVEEDYRALRQLIARYAPKDKVIPIISGEWGYSAGWHNFDEEKQARFLPRELLTNLANGIPLSIWYDWHDDGTNPKEAEHHFGLVRHEYHAGRDPVYDPKPAYEAIRALTSEPAVALAKLGAFETIGHSAVHTLKTRGIVALPGGWPDPLPAVAVDGDAKVESKHALTRGDAGDAPGGGEVLKFSYSAAPGWKFFRVPHTGIIPFLSETGTLTADPPKESDLPPQAFGVWIRGDGQGCTARIRFSDATKQYFQPDGLRITWKGWRYVTFPLRSEASGPVPHWAGANDGVAHYPIRWDSVLLLDVNRQEVSGEVWLGGGQLIY